MQNYKTLGNLRAADPLCSDQYHRKSKNKTFYCGKHTKSKFAIKLKMLCHKNLLILVLAKHVRWTGVLQSELCFFFFFLSLSHFLSFFLIHLPFPRRCCPRVLKICMRPCLTKRLRLHPWLTALLIMYWLNEIIFVLVRIMIFGLVMFWYEYTIGISACIGISIKAGIRYKYWYIPILGIRIKFRNRNTY